MADFKQHLNVNLDEVEKPPLYPIGTYHGLINGNCEYGESPDKKTPYVRFKIKLLNFGDDIAEEDRVGIKLGREMRKDFYLTPDSIYRLKDQLVKLGIPTAGRTLQQALSETPNMQVIAQVVHRPNQKKPQDGPFAEIEELAKAD